MLHALRLAALAALIFVAAPTAPACACSCAAMIGAITLGVRGEVTAVEIREAGPHLQSGIVTIAVSDVVRGPAALETVRIRFPVGDGVNCGVNFTRGTRGFFTAVGSEGHYNTNLCTLFSEEDLSAAR